ncbi:MAG: helix-turn-helix transcriptional regulator [Bacteroidota bacterium]
MELGEIIGNNIRVYRQKFGYTQTHLAEYLKIDRSTISLYESGDREISVIHLENLADLFGVELDCLVESSPEMHTADLAFAFRKQDLDVQDLKSIADFQKVVKNYIKICQIREG